MPKGNHLRNRLWQNIYAIVGAWQQGGAQIGHLNDTAGAENLICQDLPISAVELFAHLDAINDTGNGLDADDDISAVPGGNADPQCAQSIVGIRAGEEFLKIGQAVVVGVANRAGGTIGGGATAAEMRGAPGVRDTIAHAVGGSDGCSPERDEVLPAGSVAATVMMWPGWTGDASMFVKLTEPEGPMVKSLEPR